MMQLSENRIPFPVLRESEQFDLELAKIIHTLVRNAIGSLIPLENSYHLPHGKRWSLQREDQTGSDEHELKPISTEGAVAHQRLIDHDLTVIITFVQSAVKELQSQMSRLVFETVGNAADEVGNTVSAADHATLADAFLEMMRKIQFGIDRDGNISLPSVYIHPTNAQKFLDELRRQPASFSRDIQLLKAHKKISAIEMELERLRKFFVDEPEVQS